MHLYLKIRITIKWIILILYVFCINTGYSQTLENISLNLEKLGFESVRIVKSEGIYYVSLENNVYRWDALAISEAMNLIAYSVNDSSEFQLILTEKDVPFCLFTVNSNTWKDYKNGSLSQEQVSEVIMFSWEVEESWNKLKDSQPKNSSRGKIDLVLYPQFAYENTRLAKIYETQLNLAPAIEFSLWKGNNFTGQIIFPIHNELGYEGDFIRPGFLTISQKFRPAKQWTSTISAGNFSNSRYGIDLYFWHPLRYENLNFELRAGLTGYSHFFDSRWSRGKLITLTWSSSLSWYYERYSIELKAGAAQYIYNDIGLFATCTRFFNETKVGFYAQINEKNMNGGFLVTSPFPVKKRAIRNKIRLSIPKTIGLNYNAGTELFYGQNFRTNTADNKIKFSKLYVKEILNLQNKYQ